MYGIFIDITRKPDYKSTLFILRLKNHFSTFEWMTASLNMNFYDSNIGIV